MANEFDQEIQALWTAGATSPQIAEQLKLTRNKVIGRLRDMKLLGERRKNAVRKPRLPQPRRVAVPRVRLGPQPLPEPLYIPLLELQPGDCRYPFGDQNFTFCGCPALAQSSYCIRHVRMVYRQKASETHPALKDPMGFKLERAF